MSELTKKDLADQLRRSREDAKALRYEVDFMHGERRAAEVRERATDRRNDLLQRRLHDLRTCLAGVEKTKRRMVDLNAQFTEAQQDLTVQVLELEVPPSGSGHDAMNEFIAGPVVDGKRDRSARG